MSGGTGFTVPPLCFSAVKVLLVRGLLFAVFLPQYGRKRPFVSAPLSMPLAEYPSCRLSRRQGMAKIERAFAQWYNRIG